LEQHLTELKKLKEEGPGYTVTYTVKGEEKQETFPTSAEADKFIADLRVKYGPPKRKVIDGVLHEYSDMWGRWFPVKSPYEGWSEVWGQYMPMPDLYKVTYTEDGIEKYKSFQTQKEAQAFINSRANYSVTFTQGGVERTETFRTQKEAQDFVDSQKTYSVTYTERGKTETKTFQTEEEAQSFIDTYKPASVSTGRTQRIRERRKKRRKRLKKLGRMDLIGPGHKEEREALFRGEEYEEEPDGLYPTESMVITAPEFRVDAERVGEPTPEVTLVPLEVKRRREELKDIRLSQASIETKQHLLERKTEALQDIEITSTSDVHDAIKEFESHQEMAGDIITHAAKIKVNLQNQLNETNTWAQNIIDNKDKYNHKLITPF